LPDESRTLCAIVSNVGYTTRAPRKKSAGARKTNATHFFVAPGGGSIFIFDRARAPGLTSAAVAAMPLP
jgi:hypothetical protein